MGVLNTDPLLAAGSALRDAIMSDYNEAAAKPGAEDIYRTLEYSKGRDHVDLGLLRGTIGDPKGSLGKLDAFQKMLTSVLADPELKAADKVATTVLTEGSPLRDKYDDFMKHMMGSCQLTADGNQDAVGLVRDLSTLTIAALVLKTVCNVSRTGEWVTSLHNALVRWERALPSKNRRLFASTSKDLTAALDSVADALQSRGMLRLAREVDTVSDLLDK